MIRSSNGDSSQLLLFRVGLIALLVAFFLLGRYLLMQPGLHLDAGSVRE